MLWGMLGGFGGAEVEVDSDSEWFVVRASDDGTEGTIETDGALEDLKDDLDDLATTEEPELNSALPCEEACAKVAPAAVKTWAEVVKSPALAAESPPVRPTREASLDDDFMLEEPAKPCFILGDGPCELSEKDLATAKYSRRCKDRSFGHTMRTKAKPTERGIWKLEPASKPTTRGARKVSVGELNNEDVELAGPMKYAQASELAHRLGGQVQVCKGTEGRGALLEGQQLAVVELEPEADGSRVRYLVKEPLPRSKRSKRTKAQKCSAAGCGSPEWRSAALAKHKKDEFRAAVQEALQE